MRTSLFDELRARQFPPPPVPRLKPNLFARIARFAWSNATALLAFWALFACVGLLLSFAFAYHPKLSRLPLPLDAVTSQMEVNDFAGLANLQTISLTNPDAATLASQRADLVASLHEKTDIYELVFAPGANEFYDDYAMLFRPLDEVKSRVAYALSLKPLFDAIAVAPNAQSMTTLVSEIAGAIQLGRGSQGVSDLLTQAATSVQALANGEDMPLDWAKVAELNLADTSQAATILALPKPGQEALARHNTTKLLSVLRDSSATRTQLFQAAAGQAKPVPQQPELLRILAAGCIGISFVGLLLAVFLGTLRMVSVVCAPMLVLVAPTLAAFFYLGGGDWLSYWPALFAVLFCVLLLALRFVFLLGAQAANTPINQTSSMIVAQAEGARFLMLVATLVAPWIVLPVLQHALLGTALIVIAVLVILAPICILTLTVALLRFWPNALDWRASEWLVPAHQALFETRYWKIVAPTLGGLIVIGCLAFAVSSSGGKEGLQSDAAVSIVAQDRDSVERAIGRLKSFSGARAVRWLGMFLPDAVDEKRAALHELAGKFPRITPVLSEAPADLRDQIDTMQESLSRIAKMAAADKTLADSADQFRRSLALLAASENDQPITQLENRLFGGFNRLADRAEQLSTLVPLNVDTLPTELQRLFGQGKGPYRIEIDAAPGTSNAQLAVTLDQAGFQVIHPAALQARFDSQKQSSLVKLFLLSSGLLVLTLFVTFRSVKMWLTVMLFWVAASLVALGINALWQSEQNLPWLLGVLAILSCLGGFLHIALARGETSADSLVEMFMIPCIFMALATGFYALGIDVVANEAMPLAICVILIALVVGLFHHHSSAMVIDEAQF